MDGDKPPHEIWRWQGKGTPPPPAEYWEAILRDQPSRQVFEWLGEGSPPDKFAYIVLARNPGGGARGDRVLANLANVARRLDEDPEYWRALIRERDWRFTVIGCSAVLLSRDRRYFEDLLDHFNSGSFVAAQLAVALALVHPMEAMAPLEEAIRQDSPAAYHKQIFEAYATLKRMGSQAAPEFEGSELFRRYKEEDPRISKSPACSGLMSIKSVNYHWDFWRSRSLP